MTMDFRNGQPQIPAWVTNTPLRMILWAGDGFHENCDIERLPNFDFYVCLGLPPNFEVNKEYIETHGLRKTICIIDTGSSEQMNLFCTMFRGRFSHIDADYMGNTPILEMKYYDALLAPEGIAYNVRGINSIRMPTEELYNALELFAPVLPEEMNNKRLWTDGIMNLAIGNTMKPEHVWQSQALKVDVYRYTVTVQNRFHQSQLERSQEFDNARKYREADLEEYWSKLPIHILTVNLDTAWIWAKQDGTPLEKYHARLVAYLKTRLIMNPDIEKYAGDNLRDIQHCLKLQSFDAKPLESHLCYFEDMRMARAIKFDIILRKNVTP
jgi:hypothetical protein